MEPRTVRKSTIYQMILAGVATALMIVFGLLWNANTDLIKTVQAQCVTLEDKKVDKDMFKYLIERLDRIEHKIDDM